MKRRRDLLAIAFVGAAIGAFLIAPPTAGAYGNQAVWQVGVSLNCNVPHSAICDQFGGTGGFWGWYEFDANNTGDAQLAFCGHTVGGGGGAGAGHASVDITGWRMGPDTGPIPSPNGLDFYITSDITRYTGRDAPPGPRPNQFVGDTEIPAYPGHYSLQLAPGVTAQVTVALKPTA